MNPRRVILGILAACLVTALLLGGWLRLRAREGVLHRDADRSSPPSPSATVTETPSPTMTVAVRHRLAGTVVGDMEFAVVDDPSGSSELYRPGQTVPGLGRLVAVEAERAVFEGESGRIELRLLPPPTPTKSATARAGPPHPAAWEITPAGRRWPFPSASEPSP